MTAYCTIRSVRQAIAPGVWPDDTEPATKTNTAADVPNAQITNQIAEASSRIDTYIGGRYHVPVAALDGDPTAFPSPIGYWARDIAAYLTLLVWRKNQNIDPEDPIPLRYAQVIAEMIAVRDGKATLLISGNDGTGGTAGAGQPINLAPAMFSPCDFDIGGPQWPDPRSHQFDGLWHDRY